MIAFFPGKLYPLISHNSFKNLSYILYTLSPKTQYRITKILI